MELVNEIAEVPAAELAPLPPVDGRTERDKRPAKLFLMGGGRGLAQKASDSLWNLAHRLHASCLPAA